MSIIKSLSVGNGDTFYIVHGSDNFTIIDCCIDDDTLDIIDQLKEEASRKGITRVISTHPDDDHIRGLVGLDDELTIRNFYCVENEATKPDETDDFDRYCELRDHGRKSFYLYRGCTRRWMNQSDEERGSSGINILWPIRTNEHFKDALKAAKDGESANNICPIVKYSLNDGVTVIWMGDLETEFMENVEDAIVMDAADILFAPHHGRKSGKVPAKWLKEMGPKVVILGEAPAEELDYYAGFSTISQNSAGDIILECETGQTHFYVSNYGYHVGFLEDEDKPDTYGKYIGTLRV